METIFETMTFDTDELLYRAENGETVRFTKLLHVRLGGEVLDLPLSYATLGGAKVPCVRVDGQRIMLDDADLEIASDCVIPLG
jgi:hypothetical protein